MIENPRLKDRSHPDLESIQAILKQIEGALAVRRQKADHSRRAEYESEDLDLRRYICRHVLDYHDQMDDALVEFWLECIRYDGSYDLDMERPAEESTPDMREQLSAARAQQEAMRLADDNAVRQRAQQERERQQYEMERAL
mgnify:FL=1